MEESMLIPSIYPFALFLAPLKIIHPIRKPAIIWDLESPEKVTQNTSGARDAIEVCL